MAIKKIEVGMPAGQVQASIAAIIDYQLGAGTSDAISNWSNLTNLLNEAAAEANTSGIANNDPGFTVRARINDMIDACGIPEGAGWYIDYANMKYHNASDEFVRSSPRWLTLGGNEVLEFETNAMAWIAGRGVVIGQGTNRATQQPLDFSKWAAVDALTTTLPAIGSFPTPARIESTGSVEDRIEDNIVPELAIALPKNFVLRIKVRYRGGTSGSVRVVFRSPTATVSLIGPVGALEAVDQDFATVTYIENRAVTGTEYEVEALIQLTENVDGATLRFGVGPNSEDPGRYVDVLAALIDTGPLYADWSFATPGSLGNVSPDTLIISFPPPLTPKRWLVRRETAGGDVAAATPPMASGTRYNYTSLFGAHNLVPDLISRVWGEERLFSSFVVGESEDDPIYRGVGPGVGSYGGAYPMAEYLDTAFQLQEYATTDEGEGVRKGVKLTVNRPSGVSAGEWPEHVSQFGNLVFASMNASLPILEGYEWVFVTDSQAVAWFETPGNSGEFFLTEVGALEHVYLE